jgi:hypothetical protein
VNPIATPLKDNGKRQRNNKGRSIYEILEKVTKPHPIAVL